VLTIKNMRRLKKMMVSSSAITAALAMRWRTLPDAPTKYASVHIATKKMPTPTANGRYVPGACVWCLSK
jgi:hypothetical protein